MTHDQNDSSNDRRRGSSKRLGGARLTHRGASRLASAIALGAAAAAESGAASAAVFTVDDVVDAADAVPGDGVCASNAPSGTCTLRAAIQETNTLPGRDTILLPPSTMTLAIAGTEEDAAAQGDLDILDDLDIKGAGPSVSIVDGGGLDRVFDCDPNNVAGPILVRMAGLTIRNGSSWGGGGIRFASALQLAGVVLADNTASLAGGALLGDQADGMGAPALTLVRSDVHDNTASGDGGGIDATDTVALLVRQSWFTKNTSSIGDGGAVALSAGGATVLDSFFEQNAAFLGGGLSSLTAAAQDIRRSTFHLNSAFQGGGAHFQVASIANATFWDNVAQAGGGVAQGGASSPIALNNVTFKGNWAQNNQFSGGSAILGSLITMSNTVLDDNLSLNGVPSCQANSLTSLGYNVADDNTCHLTNAHDLPVASTATPIVADFGAMNGGIMLTNAPVTSSQAIDGGNPAAPGIGAGTCEPDDQRQVARPAIAVLGVSPAVCDIGAVEVCNAPANAPDRDGDGIPDVCDGDSDGDGCLDENDQHPHDSSVRGGPILNVCGGNGAWTYYEGADDDGDGLPNCEDDDDDDDGVPDDLDPCPQNPGTSQCARPGSNPCPPLWYACLDGDCNEQFLKWVYLPDPARTLIFEHYSVANDRFYATAPTGSTAAESIMALARGAATGQAQAATASAARMTPGSAAVATAVATPTAMVPPTPGPAAAAGRPIWRLEVWSRGTKRGDSGKLLGVVAELSARDIVIDAINTGNIVSILPPVKAGAPLRLATAWGIGSTGARLPDADGDGWPDTFDNCVFTPNATQADANRNGMGDACEVTLTSTQRLSTLARVVARASAAGLGQSSLPVRR